MALITILTSKFQHIILNKVKKPSQLPMLLFLSVFLCFSCKSSAPPAIETEEVEEISEFPVEALPERDALPVSAFGEIWAYVVADREAALKPGLPITDIA
jgi:hypothetical protein